MVKVMKGGGKLVSLYVIGRMAWFILGIGFKRATEKHYMELLDADFKTAATLGSEAAGELVNEAKQGWSYVIG